MFLNRNSSIRKSCHLFIYVSLDSQICITCYNPMLSWFSLFTLSHLWLLGALSGWLLCPFDIPAILFCTWSYVLSQPGDSSSSRIFPISVLESATSRKNFIRYWNFKAKILNWSDYRWWCLLTHSKFHCVQSFWRKIQIHFYKINSYILIFSQKTVRNFKKKKRSISALKELVA